MITRKYTTLFLPLIATAFVFEGSTALAVPATAPTSTNPGVIQRSLEPTQPEISRPEEVFTIRKESADGKGLDTKKSFTLHHVVLDGSTVYTPQQVDELSKDYLGKPTSFADLYTLSRTLTAHYREDGYIISKVILPPQKIKNGTVHLQAVEGRIVNVKVVGNVPDKNNLIHDMANKIKSSGPANTKHLERYLLLINDLPGIHARSVVQPDEKIPGAADVIITVEEKKFEGSVSFDNRGSKFLGPYNATAVGAFNSLFGIHDRTTLRGITTVGTDEMRFMDITHEEQLGTEGTRLKGRFAITSTKPGGDLESLDIRGLSRLFDLEVMHPLIRNRQYNVNLIGGFTAINSDTDILGVNTGDDNIRLIRGGGHVDFTDPFAGVNQIDAEIAQGIFLFGTSDEGVGRSRASGEPNFTRENFTATRLQDIWGPFSVKLSGTGQNSNDPLWVTEQFAIGGPEFGRAYDTGEITGDSGLAGLVELRYTGEPPGGFLQNYQFYGYYDGGKVWNNEVAFGEIDSASLASAGFGVRFNTEYDFTGYVELDKPLTRPVNSESDNGSRLFFSILKRF